MRKKYYFFGLIVFIAACFTFILVSQRSSQAQSDSGASSDVSGKLDEVLSLERDILTEVQGLKQQIDVIRSSTNKL